MSPQADLRNPGPPAPGGRHGSGAEPPPHPGDPGAPLSDERQGLAGGNNGAGPAAQERVAEPEAQEPALPGLADTQWPARFAAAGDILVEIKATDPVIGLEVLATMTLRRLRGDGALADYQVTVRTHEGVDRVRVRSGVLKGHRGPFGVLALVRRALNELPLGLHA